MKAFNSNRKKRLIKRFFKGVLTIDCNRVDYTDFGVIVSPRGTKVRYAGNGGLCFKRYHKWEDRHTTLDKISKFLKNDFAIALKNFRVRKILGISNIIDKGLATTRKEASDYLRKNYQNCR